MLLNSTKAYEIWGGIPAKRIGYNTRGMDEDGISTYEIRSVETIVK